jgi:chromosome segregation ATPase
MLSRKMKMLLTEKEKNRRKITVLRKEKEHALYRVNELEIKETELNHLLPKLTDSHIEWREMALYRIMINEEKKVLQDFIRDKYKEVSVAATSLAQVDKIIQEFSRKRWFDEKYISKKLIGKLSGIKKHQEKRLRKSEVKLKELSDHLNSLEEVLERERKGNIEHDKLRTEVRTVVRTVDEKFNALEMRISKEQKQLEAKFSKLLDDTEALSDKIIAFDKSFQSTQKELKAYNISSELIKRGQKRSPVAIPITYQEVSSTAVEVAKYHHYGTTYDYSESGLSFFTHKPLFEGAGVDILCKSLWDEHKAGSVCWCKTIDFNFYLVGVSLH